MRVQRHNWLPYGATLNAAHTQLLEKLRLIALAETCRFPAIQSLEFQEIWQNNKSETTWVIYRKKSEFWHREFLIKQKPFLSLVFNQPCGHDNSTHLSHARIKSSVVNLDSCKKRSPKHKWLKSNGELVIGSSKLCSATLNYWSKRDSIMFCAYCPLFVLF